MLFFDQGLAYWEIAKRYNTHKRTSQTIGPTAVRDMQRLQPTVRSPAVLRRIHSFIANHPVKSSPPTGPRVA